MAVERVGWNSALRVADQLQAARDQIALREGVVNAHRDITPPGVVDQIKAQAPADRTNPPKPVNSLGGTATENLATPLRQLSVRTGFTSVVDAMRAFRAVFQGPNAANSPVNQSAEAGQPGLPSDYFGMSRLIRSESIYLFPNSQIVQFLQQATGVKPQ